MSHSGARREGAVIAGLIGQTAIRAVAYKSWSPPLESELAAGRDNPGATFANTDLIALRSSALFAWRVRPTLHAAQTAALAARGAGLSSPLPSTRYFGYFPLRYVEPGISCARRRIGTPHRTPLR